MKLFISTISMLLLLSKAHSESLNTANCPCKAEQTTVTALHGVLTRQSDHEALTENVVNDVVIAAGKVPSLAHYGLVVVRIRAPTSAILQFALAPAVLVVDGSRADFSDSLLGMLQLLTEPWHGTPVYAL